MTVVDPCLWNTESISLSIAPDAVSLQADVNVSEQYGNGVEVKSDGLYVAGAGPAVTGALPNGVEDGFVVRYSASSVAWWELMWSSAIAKWVFLGGTPLYVRVSANDTTASASYTDLANVGPKIIVPNGLGGGDWSLRFGCRCVVADSGNAGFMAPVHGGGTPVDGEAIYWNGQDTGTFSNTLRINALADGGTINMRYKVANSGQNVTWVQRWLEVLPVTLNGTG